MDLEVLAPVGDENGIKIAINSGANAVYFGLPRFNARAKADNITLENLRDIVAFSHLHNVKVYVTINTIVRDSEVDAFCDMVRVAIDSKVDAFIIQDLGMVRLLRSKFKGIVLHASTQMGIHNLAGAMEAERLGITRVVLSRETKLEDIVAIKNNTKLEIEYFVQGALCVAFSGNCYLSSLNADKSGNRGECMQLCRLKYSAVSNSEQVNQGYLLSTCDLCLARNLRQLIDAGVTSFKIEGRLRRYGYIAEATSRYANAIKNIENVQAKDIENAMRKVFNRGEYNTGIYLDENNRRDIINEKFQNHRGVCVGKVKAVSPFKTLYQITLSSTHKLNTNDGLKFVKDDNEISIGVGNVVSLDKGEYKIYSNKRPEVGSAVYLTVDSTHEKELTMVEKKIPVSIYVEMEKDAVPYIRLRSGDTELEVYGDTVLEPAKNAPISIQNVIECFEKVDNFPFSPKVSAALHGVFIPKSVLNELRRSAYEKLYDAIVFDYEKKNIKSIKETDIEDIDIVDDNGYSVAMVDKYIAKANDFDKVIFAPHDYSVTTIREFKEKYGKKFYLDLPIIMNSKDKEVIDKIFAEFGKDIGYVANNIWAIDYARQGFDIIGGYKLNIANKYMVDYLNSVGITTYFKSVEPILYMDMDYGLSFNGNVALMTLCHCPYKTSYNYKDCTKCHYVDDLHFVDDIGHDYKVNRYMVANCYFELVETNQIKPIIKKGTVSDLR